MAVVTIGASVLEIWQDAEKVTRVLWDGKGRNTLEQADLVTRIVRMALSGLAVAVNIASLCLVERDISGTIDTIVTIVNKISTAARCLQGGLHFFVGLANGTEDVSGCLELIGAAGSIFVPDIAKALTRNAAAYWWASNCLEAGMQGLVHGRHVVTQCERIAALVQSRREGASATQPKVQAEVEVTREAMNNFLWDRLQRFIASADMLPSRVEMAIEEGFINDGLQRFMCSISHKIILAPMKDTCSGLFFEKSVILSVLQRNAQFSFEGRVITREALFPSPKDQRLIARGIRTQILAVCNGMGADRQQRASGALTQEEFSVCERLERMCAMVSFVAIKVGVCTKVCGEFNSISNMIQSRAPFPVIDPRRYLVCEAKMEVAEAKGRLGEELESVLDPQELKDRLMGVSRKRLIRGFLGDWLFTQLFSPQLNKRIKTSLLLINRLTVGDVQGR